MSKVTCKHLNTDFSSSNTTSWGYGDYEWFLIRSWFENKEDWIIDVWFQSNLNAIGWVLNKKMQEKYLYFANSTKPIVYLFSDFLILLNDNYVNKKQFVKGIDKTLEYKELPEDMFLVHYCKEEQKFKDYIKSKKTTFKFKDDHIIFFDLSQNYFHSFIEPKEETNKQICYIGNHRSWNRNEFLNKFKWLCIYEI